MRTIARAPGAVHEGDQADSPRARMRTGSGYRFHEGAPQERAERELKWAVLMEAGRRGIEGGHGVARGF